MDASDLAPSASHARTERPAKASIIGAGIGGLTTAIALRAVGIESVVFERRNELQKIAAGGGVFLWNNAMWALRQLGLAERVGALGGRVERVVYQTWRGTFLGEWPAGVLERELGAPAVAISRADLLSALVDALDAGMLRLGVECVGFDADVLGVTARFASGSGERGDLLIGADGINSAVRAQLHVEAKPRYAGYTIWQGIAPFAHELAPDGLFSVTWGPGARFNYCPIGGGRQWWVAIAPAPEGEQDPEGRLKESLLGRFRGWAVPIEAMIAATEEGGITRLDVGERRPLKRWGEGRVTLLGDAAHPITLNVPQGACQAMEDAIVLAMCFDSRDYRTVPEALHAYEARRLARTAFMIKRSAFVGRLGLWTSRPAVALRDRIMKVTMNGVAWKEHKQHVGNVGYELRHRSRPA